jgi:hypothetical protein
MGGIDVVQQGGFFDTTAARVHALMTARLSAEAPNATRRIVCAGFAGNVLAAPILGVEGEHLGDYEVLSEVGKLVKANVTHRAVGRPDDCRILQPLGALSDGESTESTPLDNTTVTTPPIAITSSSVANPTVITTAVKHRLASGDTIIISGHTGMTPDINGTEYEVTVVDDTTFTIAVDVTVAGSGGSFVRGKTTSGGTVYLQMTGLVLGGYTNAIVTLRDSPDDIAYSDVASFTAMTAIGAQRLAVAGTIERYTAISVAFTGAGADESATFLAALART